MKNNKSKALIITLAVCCVALFIFLTAHILLEEDNPRNVTPTISPTAQITQIPTDKFTALITGIDLDTSRLVLFSLDDGSELTLSYSGATDFKNKHDRFLTAPQLTIGYVADITYDTDALSIISLHGSADTWEYKNVRNLVIEDNPQRMSISDTIYRYDERLHILSDGSFISLSDINSLDIFSVIGIDNYIHLIVVSSGHGYLELANAEDFIGGTLYLGRDNSVQITENMQLTLAEGNYSLRAENNNFSGSADIKISRDKTAVFNLAEYGSASIEYGEVTFNIRPDNAELYIDGVKHLHDDVVSLTLGTHDVEAVLGGYTPYSGSIEVTGTRQTYNIALSESPDELTGTDPDELDDDTSSADVTPSAEDDIPDSTTDDDDAENTVTTTPDATLAPDATATPSPTSSETESEPSPTPSPTPVVVYNDSDYRIIVKCTEGAYVYANDTFVGIIENGSVSFAKEVGTLSLRLELAGYTTKNYIVEVESGAYDVEFSFPGMVRE